MPQRRRHLATIGACLALATTACGGSGGTTADSSDKTWCKDYVTKNVNYQGTGFDTAVTGCLGLLRDGVLTRS